MDKVIIDRVDVSGCNMKCNNGDCALYYAELNNDNNELIYGFNCSDNQDCYYKQLKRLQHYQAEFEHELMNDYTYDGYISPNGFTPIDVIKHIKSELKRLQAENERLKEEVKKIGSNFIKKGDYARDLEKELVIEHRLYLSALNTIKILQTYRNLYKQTLQDIKDIADRTDGNHPASVINMVSVIRHTINSVIGAE